MAHFATRLQELSARTRRLPFSRDQMMMLMIAINELFLGIDTYLAHSESGTIVPREWIAILFGFTAGTLLLFAGLIALRNRPLASLIATLTLVASIGVGLLGGYFHLMRAAQPFAPAGERLTLELLVWAPPILGPAAFAMVGVLGISAAWIEEPPDSGTLTIWRDWHLHLPYSKTRAYFFIVGMGMVAALVSSVLDHARTGFAYPSVWFATAVGIFGMVAAVTMGAIDHPSRIDYYTYVGAMVLLLIAGPIGTWRHVQADLTAANVFVLERFLRGAPFLAPLLYANMGLLGLIVLLGNDEAY
ncbi:MAG TPA: hypothetical protein P5121_01530 [Caldilineaceae bacterium]|nr:hypothetical protein [Caldilineaceae bacterium]